MSASKVFLNKYVILIISTSLLLNLGYNFRRPQFEILIISVLIFSFFNYYQKEILWTGLFYRSLFLFSIPFLSQDYVRFIWDGHLNILGINPYLFTPIQIQDKINNAGFFIHQMGDLSANNYSNYPPLNQLFFTIGAYFGANSMLFNLIIFRIFIILSDVGIYFFGKKILANPTHIKWYFLNPLVIIEGAGNVHFEVMMLFFMVWACYLIQKNKLYLAFAALALGVLTKLIPLLILPGYFPKLAFKKLLLLTLFCIVISAAGFLYFIDYQSISHFQQSIGLWFGKFEFNASIYYLVRYVGFIFKGYNIIAMYGLWMPVAFISVVGAISLFTKYPFEKKIFTILLIYFLWSTTVHPWYIITVLFFSVYSQNITGIAWSILVFLSYSAYGENLVNESPYFLFLEYGILALAIMVDIKKSRINRLFYE